MEFMNDISFTGLCSQSTNAAGRSSNALRGAPSDSDVAHFRESLGERPDERAPAGAKEGAEAKDSKDERVSSIEGLFKGFSGLPGAAAGVSAASAGLGAEAASAAYKELGLTGLKPIDGPLKTGEKNIGGEISFFIRKGVHFFSREDWGFYLESLSNNNKSDT